MRLLLVHCRYLVRMAHTGQGEALSSRETDKRTLARASVFEMRLPVDPFMYRWTMYHVPCEKFGELRSRSCGAGASRISEATRFLCQERF